jgi:7 transmembrane receptor (Secretin family)
MQSRATDSCLTFYLTLFPHFLLGFPSVFVGFWTILKAFTIDSDNDNLKQLDDVTSNTSSNENVDSKFVCSWMRESNIDWIIQGPAFAVLIINLIFLVRIMWVSNFDGNQK